MKTNGMMKGLVLALVVGMVTASSLFAQGGDGSNQGGKGQGKKMEKALAKLDLTEQQQTQINQLQTAFKTKNEGAINEIKTLQEKAREQKQSGDKEGAKATREQIKSKRETLKTSTQELRQQISSVLTEEQKAKLAKMGKKGKKGKKG